MIRLLYIEPDQALQKQFKKLSTKGKIQGELFLKPDFESAEKFIREEGVDVIFTNHELGEQSAFDLIEVHSLIEGIPIVVISDAATVKLTRELLKAGAYDLIPREELSTSSIEEVINGAIRLVREKKLREALENRLDGIYANTLEILENTTDGIWSLDENGKLLIINSIAKENIAQHGKGKAPVAGDDFFPNVDPLFTEIWEPIYNRVLQGEDVITVDEYRDGDYKFYLEMACTRIVSNEETVGVSFVARNVTEREVAEAKVRESEKNFRSVFTGSDVPIMVVSKGAMEIVDLNIACDELHQKSHDEMIGRPMLENIPVGALDEFKTDFKQHTERAIDVLQTNIQTSEGDLVPVQLSITEITYGQEPCFLIFMYDISARIETENRLKQARELAEKSAEFKSLFLANMSHEIRTPMNAMLGFADLLKKTELSEEQQEYIDIIRKSGQDLLVIINDILDLTKIEAGKLQLRPRNFNLVDAINGVVRLHKQNAKSKGIGLSLQLDGSLPEEIHMDDIRLSQILNNLIGNALKFTEQGEVSLKVDLLKKGEVDHALFLIKDSGIGIPEVELETIFENFNQVDSSLQRSQRGTGLGLSIVSQLCELMGGTIAARSKVGEGSEFEVILPLQDAKDEVQVKTDLDKREIVTNELHVLICEDNPINVKLATKILDDLDITYTIAENGKKGIELLKDKKPTIIFMDLQMPVMDGYEATKEIRKFSDIPIIAMSAHVLEEEQAKCLEAGMNGFIPKPFQPEHIINELKKQFSFDQQKVAVQSTDKWKELNMPGLTNLAKGDEDFAVSLFDIFIEQANQDLVTVKKAITEKDETTLKAIAHRLSPSFMMFDLVKLHIVAEKIENGNANEDERSFFADNLQKAVDMIQEKRSSFVKSN